MNKNKEIVSKGNIPAQNDFAKKLCELNKKYRSFGMDLKNITKNTGIPYGSLAHVLCGTRGCDFEVLENAVIGYLDDLRKALSQFEKDAEKVFKQKRAGEFK